MPPLSRTPALMNCCPKTAACTRQRIPLTHKPCTTKNMGAHHSHESSNRRHLEELGRFKTERSLIQDWVDDQVVYHTLAATDKHTKLQKTWQLKANPRFLKADAVRPIPVSKAYAYHTSNVATMQDNPDWLAGFLSHPERVPLQARHSLHSPMQDYMVVSMTHDTGHKSSVGSLPLAMQVREPRSVWDVEYHTRVWTSISIAAIAQVLHHHGMATCFPFFFSYGRVVGVNEQEDVHTTRASMEAFYKGLDWGALGLPPHIVDKLKAGTPNAAAYRVAIARKQAIEGFGQTDGPDTALSSVLKRQVDAGVGKIALEHAERALHSYLAAENAGAAAAKREWTDHVEASGRGVARRDLELYEVQKRSEELRAAADGSAHDVEVAKDALQRSLMRYWRSVTVTHGLVCEHMVHTNLWKALHNRDFVTQHLDSFLVQVWAGVAALNRAGFFHNDMHPAMIGLRPLPEPTDVVFDLEREDGTWVRVTCRNQWYVPMLYNFDQAGRVKRAALGTSEEGGRHMLHHRAWAYDDVVEQLAVLYDIFMHSSGHPDAVVSQWLGMYMASTPELAGELTLDGKAPRPGDVRTSSFMGVPRSVSTYVELMQQLEVSADAEGSGLQERYTSASGTGGAASWAEKVRERLNPGMLGILDMDEEERVQLVTMQHSDQVKAMQRDAGAAASRAVAFLCNPALMMKGVERKVLASVDDAIDREKYVYHQLPTSLPASALEEVGELLQWQAGLADQFWTMDSAKAKEVSFELNLALRRNSLFAGNRETVHPHFEKDVVTQWRGVVPGYTAGRDEEVSVAASEKLQVTSDHDNSIVHDEGLGEEGDAGLPYIGDLLPVVQRDLEEYDMAGQRPVDEMWALSEAEKTSRLALSDAVAEISGRGFTLLRSRMLWCGQSMQAPATGDAVLLEVLRGSVMVGGIQAGLRQGTVMLIPSSLFSETKRMHLVPGAGGVVLGLHTVQWAAEGAPPTRVDAEATKAFVDHSIDLFKGDAPEEGTASRAEPEMSTEKKLVPPMQAHMYDDL